MERRSSWGSRALPPHAGTRETSCLTWALYAGERAGTEMGVARVDIALSQAGGWSFVVALVAPADEVKALHEGVFLPAVDALSSPHADPALLREIEAHQAEHTRLVRESREVYCAGAWPDFPAIADQDRGIPAPPQRPYDESADVIDLPQPDRSILKKTHILDVIRDRESRRTFTGESLSLSELAYLLWATQGVRLIAPGGWGSARTVPSGGARHPYETYLAVNRVDGLAPGVYRYVPYEHRLVSLFPGQARSDEVTGLACGLSYVGQAAVCFLWVALPYRSEWRYGLGARRDVLIEAGHICQNLYLACESLGCGTCAILSGGPAIDAALGLDGEDEMIVYTAPVGRIAT